MIGGARAASVQMGDLEQAVRPCRAQLRLYLALWTVPDPIVMTIGGFAAVIATAAFFPGSSYTAIALIVGWFALSVGSAAALAALRRTKVTDEVLQDLARCTLTSMDAVKFAAEAVKRRGWLTVDQLAVFMSLEEAARHARSREEKERSGGVPKGAQAFIKKAAEAEPKSLAGMLVD